MLRSDAPERITAPHRMLHGRGSRGGGHALVLGDEALMCAIGNAYVVRIPARRKRVSPQLRVQRLDRGDGRAGHARDVGQRQHALDRHIVVGITRTRLNIAQTESIGIRGYHRRCDEHRDVISRLARQIVVYVPEGRPAGAALCLAHVARARIVGGKREVPVTKHLVEVVHVPCRSPSRLLRVHPVINPRVDLKVVRTTGCCHELPHAYGRGPALRLRIKAALDHRQVLQFVRRAFLVEDLLDHREIRLRPAQPVVDVPVRVAQQELDGLLDQPVLRHRDLRAHGPRLANHHILQKGMLDCLEFGEHGRPDRKDVAVLHRQRIRLRAIIAFVLRDERAIGLAKTRPVHHSRLLNERRQMCQGDAQEIFGSFRVSICLRLQGIRLKSIDLTDAAENLAFRKQFRFRFGSGYAD